MIRVTSPPFSPPCPCYPAVIQISASRSVSGRLESTQYVSSEDCCQVCGLLQRFAPIKSFSCRCQYSPVLVLELGCVLIHLVYSVCMKQTVQNREDLLISGLLPPFCPGSECDRQSGHLLLQLSVCSSPRGAEVSEPCGHNIIVLCLLSAVPRLGFYPC